MDGDDYEETLEKLQIELVKLQHWMQTTGSRVLILFEGRDAAGKGGTIDAVRQYHEPAPGAQRGADQADRDRARPVVFPALCRAVSDRRANS